jgi:hypothetical protein
VKKPLPWESSVSEADFENRNMTSSGKIENWAYPLLTSLSGNKSDRLIERSYLAETSKA